MNKFCGEREEEVEVIVRLCLHKFTDVHILDMLLHYVKIFPIRIILHPQLFTFQKLRENADWLLRRVKESGSNAVAQSGAPAQLIKTVNVRAVNLESLSRCACMNRKGITLKRDVASWQLQSLHECPQKQLGGIGCSQDNHKGYRVI